MVESDLIALIEQTIRTRLAPIDVTSIEIEERIDHKEVEALYVTINLPAATDSLPGPRLLQTMTAVSDVVLAKGDERFPYLRTSRVSEVATDDGSAKS